MEKTMVNWRVLNKVVVKGMRTADQKALMRVFQKVVVKVMMLDLNLVEL
jgi:hypothetical protein